MTTALLFAAALGMGQAAPAAAQAPAPASTPAAAAPAAQPAQASTPPVAPPVPPPPALASAEPEDPLEPTPVVRPFEMPPVAPSAPVPYAAQDAAAPAAPVKVDDYHRSYEGPQDSTEAYYDAGVKGAFAAEQALHGRLDGMWVVSAQDGAPLLSLVISDPGAGGGPLGGAWRDLSRSHDATASGLIDQMAREGESVVVRLRLREDSAPLTLRLTPSPDGRWRGQILDAGKARAVVMDRKPI